MFVFGVFSSSSVHLYYLFPSLEEGGLATYRTAIVQNQHLAMLAKVRNMPYVIGPFAPMLICD